MIPSLSQEEMTQYAAEAQTIQEPTGTDYTKGVAVGKTVPAKWWNWLFSAATKRIVQSRNDANNMLTELKNVVTDAGLTPSADNDAQLIQAIRSKVNSQITQYIQDKIGYFTKWVANSVNTNDFTGVNTATKYLGSSVVVDGVFITSFSYTSSYKPGFIIGAPDGRWSVLLVKQASSYSISFQAGKLKDLWYIVARYNTASTAGNIEVYTSENGFDWTDRSTSLATALQNIGANAYRSIAFNTPNEVYCVIDGSSASDTPAVVKTNDFTNWTAVTTDTSGAYIDINYADSLAYSDSLISESFAAIPFRGGYLFGNSFIDSNGVWSNLTYGVSSTVAGASIVSSHQGYKLASGAVLLRAYKTSNNPSGVCIFVVDANGSVTSIGRTDASSSVSYRYFVVNGILVEVRYASSTTMTCKYSTDGVNFTDFDPGTGFKHGVKFTYSNGYYYFANRRSTDFANWEDVSTLPTGSDNDSNYFIFKTCVDGVLIYGGAYPRTSSDCYVSFDQGAHWFKMLLPSGINLNDSFMQGTAVGKEGNINAYYYSDNAASSIDFTVYSTFLDINRVLGNTLYLK